MTRKKLHVGSLPAVFAIAASLVVLASSGSSLGQTYTVKTLASFGPSQTPMGLTMDSAGNLCGMTYNQYGGSSTVFRLDASKGYALSTLTSFDYSNVVSEPVLDGAGNIYVASTPQGASGTLFKLDAANAYARSPLVSFAANNNTLIMFLSIDAAGNIIGTSRYGGTTSWPGGTILKFDATKGYAPSTLVNFTGPNGGHPNGWMITDAAGNYYGACGMGGTYNAGTIFKLDASNNYAFSTLIQFSGTADEMPIELAVDSAGDLYDTTATFNGHGHVYKFDASNSYARSTLATFTGEDPSALTMDAAGNLYCTATTPDSKGKVFKLDASHGYALSTLANFNRAYLGIPLIIDAQGNIFGTANGSPAGNSTVFELSPVYAHGDANRDGVVDDNDLGALLSNWGTGTTWAEGDFNGDKTVDENDLGALLSAWTGTGAAAPEPVTLALLSAGGLAMLRRRK